MATTTKNEFFARRKAISDDLKRRAILWGLVIAGVGIILGLARQYFETQFDASTVRVAVTISWLTFLLSMGMLAAWFLPRAQRRFGLVCPNCARLFGGRRDLESRHCRYCGGQVIHDD